MPLKIDYLSLDRLNKMNEMATDYQLYSDNIFFERLEEARMDRLHFLCRALEDSANFRLGSALASTHESQQQYQQHQIDQLEEFNSKLVLIIGFFAIQQNLIYNLPRMFNRLQLRGMWNKAQLSIKKGIQTAMETAEFQRLLEIKKHGFLGCLTSQDQGLSFTYGHCNPQLHSIFISLSDSFHMKQSFALQQSLITILDAETYSSITIQSMDDFLQLVRKFGFENLQDELDQQESTRTNAISYLNPQKTMN